jgi:hypothetical protein
MSTTATYTQLRDGSWGVRAPGRAVVGQSIIVRKRDGSTKTETVKAVLWSGNDAKSGQTISLCSIAPRARERSARYDCEECGEYVERGSRCWETGMTH